MRNGLRERREKQFQEVAIDSFGKTTSNIQVNYGAGGSGKGRQDFSDMVTDYGCSDAPYKDADKANVKGGEFVYVLYCSEQSR